VKQVTIIDELETPVPGEGIVQITSDPKITALIGVLSPEISVNEADYVKTNGYRILAYMSNNPRTAERELSDKGNLIKEMFPDIAVYKGYTAPNWKLLVGDFMTKEEANVFRQQIKKSIPALGKEMYIVPDKINIPMQKKLLIMEETPDEIQRKKEAIAFHYAKILELLGEDISREGLLKTPERVAKALMFLTKGYRQNPAQILSSAVFVEDYKQMVIVKDIDFFSMCEHHALPFFGKAHVAYIPNNAVTGLSKIARIVDVFAHRLQIQERMTTQIKNCIQTTLNPLGVMVVIEAQHTCMQMRGVEKQNSITTTSDFTGAFLKQYNTRQEFLRIIGTNLHS
jgi:GTP cyclohydrolase I